MKRRKILIPLAVLFAASAAALAGCGNKDNPDPGPTPGPVVSTKLASIAISKAPTKTTYVIGETFDSAGMEITAKYEDESKKVVTGWTVDKTAPLTAEDTKVTVSYTEGEVTKTAELTIKIDDGKVHVTSINITNPTSTYPTMVVGDEIQIAVEVSPEDAENKALSYSSSNEEVVTVSSDGLIQAVAKGSASVVVASVDRPNVLDTLSITVNNPAAAIPEETVDGMKLVKSAELKDGEKVVFATIVEDKYYSMPIYTSGNNIKPVENSLVDDKLNVNAEAGLFTIVKNEDQTFSFKDKNNKYLAAVGGPIDEETGKSNNYLKVTDEINSTAKFSVAVADGVATIVCVDENTGSTTIAYNGTSGCFSCYRPDSAAGYAKINLYHMDSEGPVPVTSVVFDADSYKVGVGLTQKVSAHVLPLLADDQEVSYSLDAVDPAGCVTIDGDTLTGVEPGTAKVIATSHDGNKTAEVPVTVTEIPPIINEGVYKIKHTRADVTYYMKKGATATAYPQAVTDASQADQLEFISVPSKKDTYLIATVEDTPSYLYINTNDNKLFFGDASVASEWVITEGTRKTEGGELIGAYDIYTTVETTKRYISLYNKADFRTYSSGSAQNRLENSDLELIVERKVTSIEVTPPTKTEYAVGQVIDKTGMIVTANYSDGSTADVTNQAVVSPSTFTEAGAITVTVSFRGFTDTFSVNVQARELVSIAVKGTMKSDYYSDDSYDLTGLTVEGTYSVGDPETLDPSTYDLTPSKEVAEVGDTSINVVAKMKESAIESDPLKVDVSVTETVYGTLADPISIADAIAIINRQCKSNGAYTKKAMTIRGKLASDLVYNTSKSNFDKALIITDGENSLKANCTSVDTAMYGKTIAKDTPITVLSYGEFYNGACLYYVKNGQQVEVVKVGLDVTGIEVTTQPSKVEYTAGEKFDPTGMVVTATYEDSSKAAVTDYTYSTDELVEGQKSVTISYGGKTADVAITVAAAPEEGLDSIEVLTQPNKTTYVAGESFDATGLTLTAHYKGGKPDATISEGFTWSPNGALTVDDTTITVKYSEGGVEKTTSVTIVVNKFINVDDVDSYTVTAESIELQSGYGSGSSEYFEWTQLSKNADKQIQGNYSDSYKSELHNKYGFTKEIKYVKVTVGKASGNDAKIDFSFGNAVSPEGNVITVGKGNENCPLNKVGTFVMIPEAGSTFFSMKNKANATYIASIEFGFVDYVAPSATGVSLDKETLEMAIGDSDVQLVATTTPADASRTGEAWASDNEAVATVSNGLVHAVAEGTANITYTLNGHVATCAVKVNPASDLTPITLSKDGGTSASDAKVNGKAAIKCGTGSVAGAMKMTVPTGATKLVFYAAAWKGETVEITVAGLGENKVFSLLSDDGMTSSTPFTLKETDLSKFAITIDIAEALSEDTVITISATTGKRFAVWNAGAKIAAE